MQDHDGSSEVLKLSCTGNESHIADCISPELASGPEYSRCEDNITAVAFCADNLGKR